MSRKTMSIEAAMEEERLEVVRLMEEAEQRRNKRQSNSGGNNSDSTGRQPRPVSLLLNDEPLGNQHNDKRRSKSVTGTTSSGSRRKSYDDPADPFASEGSYYYSPDKLRTTLRSPSPSKNDRPGMHRPPSSHDSSRVRDLSPTSSYRGYPRSKSVDMNADPSQDMSHRGENVRLQKDYDDNDSSDDDDDDDDEDEDETDEEENEATKNALATAHSSLIIDEANRKLYGDNVPQSESPSNIQQLKYKSLLDVDLPPGTVPPPSMAEYAAYKRRIIHPNTAFDTDMPDESPYTGNTEEIRDARKAAGMEMQISPVHSNLQSKRAIRTMRRGDLPSLSDANTPKQKSFIVSTDLSPEATHALEWTIGTVIRDGNVLYVVCAYEDDGSGQSTKTQLEEERLQAIDQMTTSVSKLLKKTRLQVHVVLEVIHCKSPKHMLTEIIDHVTPTMVVLGSRGRSALKGVLLGSFSNYIVEKSSVPVMVARRKLQKTKNKGLNVRLANNLRTSGKALSSAKVD